MTDVRIDGRDSRWAPHRAKRREELVSHALRAIRAHGPSVGMDEIANRAGTSKTVIYRHFGDRAGLYAAIVESVHAYIHDGLDEALSRTTGTDLLDLVAELTDTYLRLVERDPEIYQFTLHRPPGAEGALLDPAGSLTDRVGDQVAIAIRTALESKNLDPSPADTWAHGLVGFIRAAADRWMAAEPRPPRDTVVTHVTAIFAPAFAEVIPT